MHDEIYCIGSEAIISALRHTQLTRFEVEITCGPTSSVYVAATTEEK